MQGAQRVRVAVIGGGCAAMTTAFELTRPELEGRYEVTVFQQGWRLGGKGASGRGVNDRIEEHGLHLWMGWYENAFRLIRDCYAELGRDPDTCRISDWQDAFKPDHFMGTVEKKPDGSWDYWKACFPPAEGLPGDPLPAGDRFTVAHYVSQTLALLRTLFETVRTHAKTEIEDVSRLGNLASLTILIEGVTLLETLLQPLARHPQNIILRSLDALARNAREQLAGLAMQDDAIRRVFTMIDLTIATMRGIVRHGLLTASDGFDSIDEYDCREWLVLNGASQETVHSSFMNGLYDLVFAYENGDATRPRMAAGQALRASIRALFTYRGAFFWKMQAGMGDVVFAPLYQTLERRGVRFEFFHRLENVGLSKSATSSRGERPHVRALEFEVQAEVRPDPVTGQRKYQPLIDVRGLPCWPSKPDYEQLQRPADCMDRDFESFWDSGGLRKTLEVGKDFDLVVLGVGLGAVPYVCRELVERDPKWAAMVEHVKTVPTQAAQLWMNVDMEELGWPEPAINISGFVEPFDTWADMRHLISEESWDGQTRAIAYFCNALPDLDGPIDRRAPTYAEVQREHVKTNLVRFLNEDVHHLWPKAAAAQGQFRWDVLVDPAGAETSGADRLDSQFWTANVNPSDRYVQSLPGSLIYRISPLDYTYDNLTIAGDWTDCGFNAGCVEAAVMSGRLAAHALSGAPRLEEIIGYDHP